jgi:hypothetical protein
VTLSDDPLALELDRGFVVATGIECSAPSSYGMSFMPSETNIAGRLAPAWLAEVWSDALTMRPHRVGLAYRDLARNALRGQVAPLAARASRRAAEKLAA